MHDRRETIDLWVGDFCTSTRFRDHAPLVREYAPQLLAAFLSRACEVRDLEPADIEEGDLRPALIEGVARVEIPGSAREGVCELVASFLEEMEAQGRLSGGRTLGLYVKAQREAYLDAAAGKGRTITRPAAKIGRNDPCPCGSGLKYKKCCGRMS